MGPNNYPVPQSPLGFGGISNSLDINWGMNNGNNLSMGMPGPAPAANATPTVPLAGTNPMSSLTVPGNVTDAMGAVMDQGGLGKGTPMSDGLGWGDMPFMDKTKAILGGVGTLANIWSAFQANKIARDSLDFQKKAYKENLTNQRSSYNMALEDRANAAASYYGNSETDRDDAAAYIARHRLGA